VGLALLLVFALVIYALVRLARLNQAVDELKQELAGRGPLREPVTRVPVAAPPSVPPVPRPPAPEVGEPARAAAPPAPPAVPSRREWSLPDLETVFGGNWLTKLGIAAIVVGAAFFLKHAFENRWIGPVAQVAIGLVASAILLGLGQFLLSKPTYRAYAQVLASGGIVILFLSIYAAYNFHHLIGFGVAFAVLALAAVSASALAMANNTQAVALICLLGAFATPLLIRQEGIGAGNLLNLYGYLAGLNLWSAILVRYRPWHSLTALSFAATWLLFFGAGPLHGPDYLTVETFAVLFLVFACYSGIRTARTQADLAAATAQAGVGMILVGCLAFIVASALILADIFALGLPALTTVGMMAALLLAGLALAFPGVSREHNVIRSLFRYLSAAALGLLMIITVAEAPPTPLKQVPAAFIFALFSYLMFLGVAISMSRRRGQEGPAVALVVANALAHVAVAFHVLEPLRVWGINAAPLWLPIAGWITIAALWLAPRQEGEGRYFRAALTVAGQSLPLFALFGALALADRWPAARGVALFGGEFLLFSGTCIAARRLVSRPGFRGDLLTAFGNAAVFFGLLATTAGLEARQGFVLLCGCAIAMAAYHALVGGSVLRRPEDDRFHRFVYLGLALTFLTIAIPLQLRTSYITLAWAVEGGVLVWTGLAVADRRVRWGGVILLSVTAAKALFLDITITPEPFRLLLNARMLSGASVIAAAYVSAWLLWRARETLSTQERAVSPVLALVGNAFTLIFLSLEVWDYVGQTWPIAGRESARQMALSVLWAIYGLGAMSVGIWQRVRPVRLFAIALLYVAILKVFFFDLSFLQGAYRIVSFLGLGVMLLIVGSLYARFESRLR
jgi:uncharacterized membrane protein